jgi:hypothetical protein
MVDKNTIDSLLEIVKFKHPRYEQSAEYWAMCLSEYDVPSTWLKYKVSQYLMDKEKPPSAAYFKRECAAFVASERSGKNKDVQKVPANHKITLVGWDRASCEAVYKAVPIEKIYRLTKSLYILKSDVCALALGWIATDLLRQGKSFEYVYEIAIKELEQLDPWALSQKVKELYAYTDTQKELRKVDPFEAIAAQEINKTKQDSFF